MAKRINLTEEIKKYNTDSPIIEIYGKDFEMKKNALLSVSMMSFNTIAIGWLKAKHGITAEPNELSTKYLIQTDVEGVGHELRMMFLETVFKDFTEDNLEEFAKTDEFQEGDYDMEEAIALIAYQVAPIVADVIHSTKK